MNSLEVSKDAELLVRFLANHPQVRRPPRYYTIFLLDSLNLSCSLYLRQRVYQPSFDSRLLISVTGGADITLRKDIDIALKKGLHRVGMGEREGREKKK